MLNKIRTFSSSLFIKALLLLIIVTMVLWGLTDSRSKKNYIVSIDNNEHIHVRDFIKAKRNFLHSSSNKNYPSSYLEPQNVNNIVLHSLIRNKLLEIEAHKLGIIISNDTAINEIKNFPLFQDKEGNFSKERFKQLLLSNQISENEYLNSVKLDAAVHDLNSIVPNFYPSTQLVNNFYQYNSQKRLVELVIIKHKKRPIAGIKIDYDQIKKYYKENKEKFKTPELRDVEYIAITPQNFIEDVEISDAELEDLISETQEKDTDISKDKLSKIKQKVILQKAEQLMHEKMKEIEDDLAAGDNLKDVASQFHLKYVTVKNVKSDGSFESINVKTVPQNLKKLLKESFDCEKNVPSDALQIKEGSSEYYILNVQDIKEEGVKSFDEVKSDITFLLQKEYKNNIEYERAKKIYSQFKESGFDKERLLKEDSQVSLESITLNRPNESYNTSNTKKIPTDIVINIFNFQNVNDMTNIFKTTDEDFAFVILKKIILPKEKPSSEDTQKISAQLSEFMNSSIHQEFMQYLNAKHKIQIHQEIIRNL